MTSTAPSGGLNDTAAGDYISAGVIISRPHLHGPEQERPRHLVTWRADRTAMADVCTRRRT